MAVKKKKFGSKLKKYVKKTVSKVKTKIAKAKTKRNVKRNTKKINKLAKKSPGSITVTAKSLKGSKTLSPTGKIRKKAKAVQVTKGGAYASYDKKSKAAGSFRKSFAAASKAGKKTFTWDGRSYSTKKK